MAKKLLPLKSHPEDPSAKPKAGDAVLATVNYGNGLTDVVAIQIWDGLLEIDGHTIISVEFDVWNRPPSLGLWTMDLKER